jgi:hypothetical protein
MNLKTMTIRVICLEDCYRYEVYENGFMVFECWLRANVTFDEIWELSERLKY